MHKRYSLFASPISAQFLILSKARPHVAPALNGRHLMQALSKGLLGPERFQADGFEGGTEPGVVVVLEMPEGEFCVLEIVGFQITYHFEETVAVGIAAGFLEEGEEGVIAQL